MTSLSLSTESSLEEWLAYLESLNPKEIELGLERVERVATQMNLFKKIQQSKTKIVTVAGTNGKGSCVATLDALLLSIDESDQNSAQDSKKNSSNALDEQFVNERSDLSEKTGVYTSPHFLHYNERIKINGEMASDAEIISAFCAVENARQDVPLTYFEFGTLAAVWHFLQSNVTTMLLEVGLGGRLDAVNVFAPDVAIVTSIALDHQDWLGDDRETIGYVKAGIYRANKPAICVDESPPKSVVDYGNEIKANVILNDREIFWRVDDKGFHWRGIFSSSTNHAPPELKEKAFDNLPVPRLPLPSVSAALYAFELLGFDLNSVPLEKVFSQLDLTGRGQNISVQGKSILLDVAHNPAAAIHLANFLSDQKSQQNCQNIYAVFGVMADKDYESILQALDASVDNWFVGGVKGVARAASGEELHQTLNKLNLTGQSFDTVVDSFKYALTQATENDLIVVLGSFYVVADILKHVQSN